LIFRKEWDWIEVSLVRGVSEVDILKDTTIKGEVKESSPVEEKTVGSKNMTGGAFHWMK
jgi:hypothetical protein